MHPLFLFEKKKFIYFQTTVVGAGGGRYLWTFIPSGTTRAPLGPTSYILLNTPSKMKAVKPQTVQPSSGCPVLKTGYMYFESRKRTMVPSRFLSSNRSWMGMVKTFWTSSVLKRMSRSTSSIGVLISPMMGWTRMVQSLLGMGVYSPRISTSEGEMKISSCISRRAVKCKEGSDRSRLPPGKEHSPRWFRSLEDRIVNRTLGTPLTMQRGWS